MPLRARLLYGTIGALCAAIAVFDGFEFLELKLLDLRYRWLDRAPSGDVVIVAIDPASLAQRGVWPWPREDHAALLERLATAGARQIAFDIDISSRSTPAGGRCSWRSPAAMRCGAAPCSPTARFQRWGRSARSSAPVARTGWRWRRMAGWWSRTKAALSGE